MASYTVNESAVGHARALIDAHHYVLDSNWGDVQPSADDENHYLDRHSWADYADWHLGLTDGANDETKARYAFVVGDLRETGAPCCQWRCRGRRIGFALMVSHESRGPR